MALAETLESTGHSGIAPRSPASQGGALSQPLGCVLQGVPRPPTPSYTSLVLHPSNTFLLEVDQSRETFDTDF